MKRLEDTDVLEQRRANAMGKCYISALSDLRLIFEKLFLIPYPI
jgi:hypothetical protein